MPEIPDLEVIREVLTRRLAGCQITSLVEPRPLALRNLIPETSVVDLVAGATLIGITRRAKFLLWHLDNELLFAINLMLSGHLRFASPEDRLLVRDYVQWQFADGQEIRLNDPNGMAKVYLTEHESLVPGLEDTGPDAIDPHLTRELFIERLRGYRGEIKGILTRGACVGGIGNAYADEILFAAGIYPFRKRTSLSKAEQVALYDAMQAVLTDAIREIRSRMGDQIELKIRDFLQIHNKKGEPCPRCGNPISEINVRKRMTNFCRTCQPGSMFG